MSLRIITRAFTGDSRPDNARTRISAIPVNPAYQGGRWLLFCGKEPLPPLLMWRSRVLFRNGFGYGVRCHVGVVSRSFAVARVVPFSTSNRSRAPSILSVRPGSKVCESKSLRRNDTLCRRRSESRIRSSGRVGRTWHSGCFRSQSRSSRPVRRGIFRSVSTTPGNG